MKEYSTPSYFHCIEDKKFRDSVYEPEADTFLFLDAIDRDVETLRRIKGDAPLRCVEIGCGSGTVITHLATQLLRPFRDDTLQGQLPSPFTTLEQGKLSSTFVAVDVNPMALEATSMTWTATITTHFSTLLSSLSTNTGKAPSSLFTLHQEDTDHSQKKGVVVGVPHLTLLKGSLFTPIHRCGNPPSLFDVVLFNPPYVPTSLEELQKAVDQEDVITAAWCGGPKGRVVTDEFLKLLPQYLSKEGACYIVLIKENDIQEVTEFIQQCFKRETISESDVVDVTCVVERFTGEHLSVYRVTYRSNPLFRCA